MTLVEMAAAIETSATTTALNGASESRSYSDRSNCRRAMIAHAKTANLPIDGFEIIKGADKDFRFRRINPDTNGGVPEFLKIDAAERREAWQTAPLPAAPQPQQENVTMARKATKTTTPKTFPASKAPSTAPAGATEGSRSRYDWSAAEEMAEKGKIPPALDFSAETHKRFRGALADVVKAAKAGDTKALGAIKINPVSSSPKALDRYRKLCLKAIKAKAA